jgi:hypothetical protein
MPEMTRRASLHSAPQAIWEVPKKRAPQGTQSGAAKNRLRDQKIRKMRPEKDRADPRPSRSGDRFFHKRERKFFRGADPLRDRMCHFLVV